MYKDYLKRKEKVIISAIDILDEGGIQALTTKELAKRQGITEPAIYKQFDSKQEILLAILDRFGIFDKVIENTIIEQKMTPRAGILYFAESYASYYQSYPQITTVMFSFDFFKYEDNINQKMKRIMEKRYHLMNRLVLEGQERGEFTNEMNSVEFSEMILGMIWGATYKWKMDECPSGLKETIVNRLLWILK